MGWHKAGTLHPYTPFMESARHKYPAPFAMCLHGDPEQDAAEESEGRKSNWVHGFSNGLLVASMTDRQASHVEKRTAPRADGLSCLPYLKLTLGLDHPICTLPERLKTGVLCWASALPQSVFNGPCRLGSESHSSIPGKTSGPGLASGIDSRTLPNKFSLRSICKTESLQCTRISSAQAASTLDRRRFCASLRRVRLL